MSGTACMEDGWQETTHSLTRTILVIDSASANHDAAERALGCKVVGISTLEELCGRLDSLISGLTYAIVDDRLYPTEKSIRSSHDDLTDTAKQAVALKAGALLRERGVLVFLRTREPQVADLARFMGMDAVECEHRYIGDTDEVAAIRERLKEYERNSRHNRAPGWG